VLGYVPDTPYLYDKLTGFEFLEFAADLYSMEPRRTHTRAEELLELFGLRESAHDLIEGYSHGMKQKLVIASVLIHDPQVIFLDEPTTALDPKSARLVKEILRTLCDQGRTVFISTHVMEIAERMCDRVAIIDHGRIAALGSLPELRQLRGQGTLEDVFLGLTGETETAAVLRVFGEEASS
jgi:ABC-2 type transport system ATP-binding protein